MDWRPYDWDRYVRHAKRKASKKTPINTTLIEIGADAILNALRDMAHKMDDDFIFTITPLDRDNIPPDGTIVIIPGESEYTKNLPKATLP